MAAVAVPHTAHAMNRSSAREAEGATPQPTRVASAESSIAHAMRILSMIASATNTAAFAMDATAFTTDGLSILGMRRCLTRSMSVAHEPTEVQAVVARNLAPALASLVHRYEVVEGQTRSISSQPISQQVRVLQFTITEPR